MRGNPAAGMRYLLRGFQMLGRPGIRLYVIVPLLFNLVVFGALIGLSIAQFGQWIDQLLGLLPGWLDFLRWLLWPVAVLLLLLVTGYLFSVVANFIAAPFNGLLAEQVEALLTGQPAPDTRPLAVIADTPRILGKELLKLLYYLPRALLVLVCSLIPVFYPIAPFLWFALGAWMMALQYCDYPMDNHRWPLRAVKQGIGRERLTSFGFGAAVMAGTLVPLLNLLIMPAAVCGATLYWVERLRPTPGGGSSSNPLHSSNQPRSSNQLHNGGLNR